MRIAAGRHSKNKTTGNLVLGSEVIKLCQYVMMLLEEAANRLHFSDVRFQLADVFN